MSLFPNEIKFRFTICFQDLLNFLVMFQFPEFSLLLLFLGLHQFHEGQDLNKVKKKMLASQSEAKPI